MTWLVIFHLYFTVSPPCLGLSLLLLSKVEATEGGPSSPIRADPVLLLVLPREVGDTACVDTLLLPCIRLLLYTAQLGTQLRRMTQKKTG